MKSELESSHTHDTEKKAKKKKDNKKKKDKKQQGETTIKDESDDEKEKQQNVIITQDESDGEKQRLKMEKKKLKKEEKKRIQKGEKKQSKKHIETDKDLKKKVVIDKSASPKDQLVSLLNHDPWSIHKTNAYDDDLTYDFLRSNVKLCRKKYTFDFGKDKLFPFTVLCALGASVRTLSECYHAHPPAAAWNDGFIGTPMHYACHYRAPTEVIQFLIEDVRVVESSSSSSEGSRDSSQDKNAMVWATNHMFRLPVHLACMAQAPLVTLKLLAEEYSQGLARVDKEGMTPLHYACDHADADLEVIEMLATKYKKAVVVKNRTMGQTPMHLAVGGGCRLDVIEALFLIDPDRVLSIADKNGNLAIHIAVETSAEMNVIQFLVWNHADGLVACNDKKDRPIDIARRIHKKNKDLAEILDPDG